MSVKKALAYTMNLENRDNEMRNLGSKNNLSMRMLLYMMCQFSFAISSSTSSESFLKPEYSFFIDVCRTSKLFLDCPNMASACIESYGDFKSAAGLILVKLVKYKSTDVRQDVKGMNS